MLGRGKALEALEPTRIKPGNLVTVRQQVPLGLGHAIWCARAIVGDEPFAIFLPDELMIGTPGCMKQMVDAYAEVGGNLISVLEVPREEVSSYGVISPGARRGTLTEVTGLVEKPKIEREDRLMSMERSGISWAEADEAEIIGMLDLNDGLVGDLE